MQSTLREIHQFVFSLNNLIIWVCISCLCVLAAPLGTGEDLSFPMLALYWFTSNALTMGIGESIMISVMSGLEDRFSLSVRLAMGSALASLAILFAVWGITALFFTPSPDLLQLAYKVIPIALIIAISTSIIMNRSKNQGDTQENSEKDGTAPTEFLERLPVQLRGNLQYLSTEDHYIRVVTDKGSHMLLMRFRDALKELENADGMQIHRSHWISTGSVTGTKRENGKLFVIMPDDNALPVSRSYAKEVREMLGIG